MRHGTVFPGVDIPAVVLQRKPVALHVRQQHVEPLLTLAATHDLADPRHQQVHRGHRLVVVVQPHVERFDLLRVVEDRRRLLEMLLGQPALMFALEVQAILDRILEALPRLLQNRHRLGVGDPLERILRHELQPLAQALVDELLEDRKVAVLVFQRLLHQVFHHRLRQVHVALQIAESHLRLDHPELRRVARGIRILRAESRPEGVDIP